MSQLSEKQIKPKLTGTVDVVNGSKNPLPFYATDGSAGMDLYASNAEPIHIGSGETILIPTGLKIALPVGYELQVRPRSGLALKNSITVLNSPGTVDADYRGNVGVILINHGKESFTVNNGDRIAQAVVTKYERITWNEVEELDKTERGEGGFGSTGKQ